MTFEIEAIRDSGRAAARGGNSGFQHVDIADLAGEDQDQRRHRDKTNPKASHVRSSRYSLETA